MKKTNKIDIIFSTDDDRMDIDVEASDGGILEAVSFHLGEHDGIEHVEGWRYRGTDRLTADVCGEHDSVKVIAEIIGELLDDFDGEAINIRVEIDHGGDFRPTGDDEDDKEVEELREELPREFTHPQEKVAEVAKELSRSDCAKAGHCDYPNCEIPDCCDDFEPKDGAWGWSRIFRYTATETIDGDPNPWTGLLCVVLDRFGMSHAGFDCAIAFVDQDAFGERIEYAGQRREWFDAEKLGWSRDMIDLAAGHPVIEANFDKELVEAWTPADDGILAVALDKLSDLGDDEAVDLLTETANDDLDISFAHDFAYAVVHVWKRRGLSASDFADLVCHVTDKEKCDPLCGLEGVSCPSCNRR